MMQKRRIKQREEVRNILHAMHLELAAHRLSEEIGGRYLGPVRLDKLIEVSRTQVLLREG